MVAVAGLCHFQWLLPDALPCTPTQAHDPPPAVDPTDFFSLQRAEKPLVAPC